MTYAYVTLECCTEINIVFMGPCILVILIIYMSTRCKSYVLYLVLKALHVSEAPCVHHQELYKL